MVFLPLAETYMDSGYALLRRAVPIFFAPIFKAKPTVSRVFGNAYQEIGARRGHALALHWRGPKLTDKPKSTSRKETV